MRVSKGSLFILNIMLRNVSGVNTNITLGVIV
jgi:hypothetical protein